MWSVVDRQVCVSLVSSEYAFEEIQPNDHLGLLKTCASWFCSSFPVGGVKERKYVPEVYTCSLFLPSRKDSAQAQAVGGGERQLSPGPGPSSVESDNVLPMFQEPGGREEEEVSEKCLATGHWVCSKPRLCSRCGIVGVPDRWTDTVRPQGQWGRGVGLGTHVW